MKIPLNELRFDFLSEGSDLYSFRSSDNDLNKFFREDALYYQQERLVSVKMHCTISRKDWHRQGLLTIKIPW